MARPYLPAALNNVNVSVNLTQPGKPVASASVPTVTEQLKSASTVIPVGEMLGRFGANLALTVQGWFDPTASQEYLDEVHADLGRDTPGTAMVVAPLALKGGAAIRAGIEGRLPAFENPYTPEALSSNPLVSPRPAPPMGAYGDLSGTLPRGMQANHLNQNAAYRSVIPSDQGTAMGLYGDAFRQPGTQHFSFHGSLESFWRPYRMGGGRFGSRPTNAQYSDALRGALRAAMLPEEDVALGVADAARQRAAFGLRPDDPVPNIPRRLPQKRGP